MGSAGDVVVDVGAPAAQPGRDRQLPQPFPAEQTQFRLEHDRHHENEHEAAEGNDEAHRKASDGDHETEDQAQSKQDRAPTRHPISALGEGGVLFEFLLDLTQDALFILGERHQAIIARFGPILNAARRVLRRF